MRSRNASNSSDVIWLGLLAISSNTGSRSSSTCESAGDCGAGSLSIEAVGLEEIARPGLLGGDVHAAARLAVDEFHQRALGAIEVLSERRQDDTLADGLGAKRRLHVRRRRRRGADSRVVTSEPVRADGEQHRRGGSEPGRQAHATMCRGAGVPGCRCAVPECRSAEVRRLGRVATRCAPTPSRRSRRHVPGLRPPRRDRASSESRRARRGTRRTTRRAIPLLPAFLPRRRRARRRRVVRR